MQVMNDLVRQIKGIRKRRRERGFIGSLNSSSRMAGGTPKAVRVSGKRVLGIPWKALGAGTYLPARDMVVNVLTQVSLFSSSFFMEMDRERLRDNQKSGAMFPHQIERLLRAGTCLSHQTRGFLRTAAVSLPSKLEPLQSGSVSPPMKLEGPSPKAKAYALVIREHPEGKCPLPSDLGTLEGQGGASPTHPGLPDDLTCDLLSDQGFLEGRHSVTLIRGEPLWAGTVFLPLDWRLPEPMPSPSGWGAPEGRCCVSPLRLEAPRGGA